MGEPSRPPPFVICHLCGRKYGTKSIGIHVPQCQEKWNAENRKLPKQLRRTIPQQPNYEVLRSGKYNADIVEQVNAQAFESAKAQLIPCQNCGRTFYPEKLPIHQRSCTAENPSRPPPSSNSVPDKATTLVADEHVEQKSVLGYNNRKHSDSNTNNNNNNTNNNNNITNKYKTTSNTEVLSKVPETGVVDDPGDQDSTTLCSICMEQIPSERIQIHLVCCNEEKVRQLLSDGAEAITTTTKASRPRTRTLRRGPPSVEVNESNGTGVNSNSNLDNPSKQDPSYSAVEIAKSDFVLCDSCGRQFVKDRISQHKKVCSKTAKKVRKTFDSLKQRMAGLEFEMKNVKPNIARNNSVKDKGNWRMKHQELIQSIRDAKKVAVHMQSGGKASDLPPPAPSLNPEYVYCQYCDRRFNPEVAERHIPKCATIRSRPAPPKKKALEVYNSEINNKSSNNSSHNNSNKNNITNSKDVNNNNIDSNIRNRKISNKSKPVKKSSTFNVQRNPDYKFQDLLIEDQAIGGGKIDLSATYNLQKNRRDGNNNKAEFRGYISPTPGKGRYDSFEEAATTKMRSKSSRPSLSSSGENHRASGSSENLLAKDSSAVMQKGTAGQRVNTGYSYNNTRRKSKTQKLSQPDFIF